MNRNSAPGPDGFGPGFYRATWQTVKVQVMQSMTSFCNGEIDLERVNRSFLVLLQKKPGNFSIDGFFFETTPFDAYFIKQKESFKRNNKLGNTLIIKANTHAPTRQHRVLHD